MGSKTDDQIDILRRLTVERDALEQQLKDQKEKLTQLRFEKKSKPEIKPQLIDLKQKMKETERRFKHAKKQVKFFSDQIGGSSTINYPLLIIFSIITFFIGLLLGQLDISVGDMFKGREAKNKLIVCEFVYSGQPSGLGPTFEIAQNKALHGYATISSRSARADYFVEWYHKKNLKDTTPLTVLERGKPVWGKKDFTLEDLGDWEAHLKTGDGDTWAITKFKIVYPKIDIMRAVMCEEIRENRPINDAKLFLAKDRTLFCFTETKSKEKYTEIRHEWYYGNELKTQQKIQLDQLTAKNFSQCAINAADVGSWYVNIIDGQGNKLHRVNFEINEQQISIPTIEFCTGIVDGKPDSIVNQFVADGNELYCYSNAVSNFPGFTIKHHWIFDNKKILEKSFVIDSLNAEVATSKKITTKQSGEWTVHVVDQKGNVLASKSIVGTKPITEQVGINRLVFCRTVFQRDPYDIASTFTLADAIKIWAHATVNNKKSKTNITYKWYYNKKLIKTNTIDGIIPSTSYRTYDYKTIYPHEKGVWTVNIHAEDGTLLKKGTFTIQ